MTYVIRQTTGDITSVVARLASGEVISIKKSIMECLGACGSFLGLTTQYHKIGCLTATKIYSLTVLSQLEIWKQGITMVMLLSETSRRGPYLSLPVPSSPILAFLGLWQHNSNICFFLHMTPISASFFILVFSSFLKDTSYTGFEPILMASS